MALLYTIPDTLSRGFSHIHQLKNKLAGEHPMRLLRYNNPRRRGGRDTTAGYTPCAAEGEYAAGEGALIEGNGPFA